MQLIATVLWFLSGMAGLHLLDLMYPNEHEAWEVWEATFGPILLLCAVIKAIDKAVKQ